MAIPINAVRIDCTWTTSVWTGLNVWHGLCTLSQAPTSADAQVLVDRLRDFYTALAGQFLTGTTITCGARVIAIGLNPEQFVTVTPRTVAGTRTGEPLPYQTSLTVKLRTPDATKRGRGRIYLSMFGEDQNTNGGPASSLLSAVNTAAAALPSSPPSALPALAVLSKIGSGTPASPNPYLTSIQTAVAGTGWTVLRSRRR